MLLSETTAMFFMQTTIEPIQLQDPMQFVDEAWNYALPSIITFCSSVIGFKVLVHFLNAGKGQ
jgi:hypothetical protein